MVTDTSTNSKFTVTFQGDNSTGGHWLGYDASCSMLRVKREDAQQVSVVAILCQPNPNNPVRYFTDPDGVLEIPLRNMLEANKDLNPATMSIDIGMTEVNGTTVDTFGKYIDIVPGLSYYDVNAPRSKDAEQFLAAYGSVVMPPNIILNPDTLSGLTAPGIIVESNLAYDWTQYASGVGTAITPTGARANQLPVAAGADTLQVSHDGKSKTYKLDKPDYCTDLVCIRWTSRTGAVRQHFFPIVGFIKGSDKQVSLISPGDGYLVDKNTYEGIRCRLTGLTAYSYWYYMDLVQASDVHAIVKQTFSLWSTEIASAQTAAFVEANEMETPQGNGFFAFEFTLKLRHYGQV